MEEIDLSKELQEFYENNKHKKCIKNWEESIKSTKGFFGFFGNNFLKDKVGGDDILLKDGRVFTSIHNEKDFIFSLMGYEVLYYKKFLLFRVRPNLSNSYKFLKVNYSNIRNLGIKYENLLGVKYPFYRTSIEKEGYKRDFFEGNKLMDLVSNKLFIEIHDIIKTRVNNHLKIILDQKKLDQEKLDQEKLEKYKEKKKKYLELVREFDKDNNGTIDVVEGNDFSNILKKYQEKIIEINRDYIKQFVQVSNYLKLKRKSLQNVFESLNNAINEGGINTSLDSRLKGINVQKHVDNNQKLVLVKEIKDVTGLDLKEAKEIADKSYLSGNFKKIKNRKIFIPLDESLILEHIEILKDDIHIYNLLLVQSLNMVASLVKNDMITFYEIYEKFDELNMFDSKHERDLRNHLQNVNENLEGVMNQIQIMGENIISSIGELSMISEESSKLITDGLDSVNSLIKASNLINSVKTYQLYRIGKNIKSLRE